MPSHPRPRNYTSGSNGSGRSAPNAPMSERQQMALVMQMHTSNQSNQGSQSQAGRLYQNSVVNREHTVEKIDLLISISIL